MLGWTGRLGLAFATQGQGIGQVFLDRHRRARGIVWQVDDRKTAGRQLPLDAVALQFAAGWQSLIVLGHHDRECDGEAGRVPTSGTGKEAKDIYCRDFPCSPPRCKQLLWGDGNGAPYHDLQHDRLCGREPRPRQRGDELRNQERQFALPRHQLPPQRRPALPRNAPAREAHRAHRPRQDRVPRLPAGPAGAGRRGARTDARPGAAGGTRQAGCRGTQHPAAGRPPVRGRSTALARRTGR
jgi:hypothetical protein